MSSLRSRGDQNLLRQGYRACARITRQHGTTYYWGTVLLPPAQRRQVYAVYALCRLADDIVDAPGATTEAARLQDTGTALQRYADRVMGVVSGRDVPTEPVLAAIADTARRTGIDPECFDRFFGAMTRDLTDSTYASFEELCDYMEGSAAVIGEMMLPVLRPRSPAARGPARALGLAFQVTNFLRDVGEDLDRGRVYLPQDELRAFGADPWARRVTNEWRGFMRHQIERNRRLYAEADLGIPMLPGASARCVTAARVLYARILDEIERHDYDVFSARRRVPTWQKAATAAAAAISPAAATATASGGSR